MAFGGGAGWWGMAGAGLFVSFKCLRAKGWGVTGAEAWCMAGVEWCCPGLTGVYNGRVDHVFKLFKLVEPLGRHGGALWERQRPLPGG